MEYGFCMGITANELFKEALELPPAARADLAEKIIESVEAEIPPAVQQAHLREIQRRRQEVKTGQVQLIPGDVVLQDARDLLK